MTIRPTSPTFALATILAAAWWSPHTLAQDAAPAAPAISGTTTDPSDVDGTVAARYDARLAFPILGPIASVPVAPGDRVEAGQLLATLDDRIAQAEAALAKLVADNDAEVRAAEARLEAMRADRAAAPVLRSAEAEVNRAKLEHDRAQRQLALAAARLDAHRLKAPSAGIVEQVLVSPGEVVQPGQPVLRLIDPSQRFVDATIPSDRAESLAPGHAALILPRRQGNPTPIPAELVRLSATVDPATDARAARFRLLDDTANLPIGAYVGIDLDPPANPGTPTSSGDTSSGDTSSGGNSSGGAP